jgi:multimeric flavodoxin WrbA
MTSNALLLNCTLKPSPSESSCGLMLSKVSQALSRYDVQSEIVRVVDYDIRPGVSEDEGNGDEWPALLEKVKAAEILVMGSPVWMGSPSSVCKRVAERLDAMLSFKDDASRLPTFSKVAGVAVVGNEDGAHHVAAECFQWLNDVGYTIPAGATAYWVGEAMQPVDFKDLDEVPDAVQATIEMLASNTAHLARTLSESPYVGVAQ